MIAVKNLILQIQVNINQDFSGFIFDLMCNDESYNQRLLHRKGFINKEFKQVCSKETVRIAYNNYGNIFQLDSAENIVKYPYPDSLSDIRPGEILSPFLNTNNLLPKWTNCNGTWGSFRNGRWTGAVAEVIFADP